MTDLDAVEDGRNVLVTTKSTNNDHCSDLLETGDPNTRAELTVSLPEAVAGTIFVGTPEETTESASGAA